MARYPAIGRARARRLRHLCGLDWIRRRERHVGFVVHRRSGRSKSSCKPRPRNPASCAPISTCVKSISRAARLPLLGDLGAVLPGLAAGRRVAASARRAMTLPVLSAVRAARTSGNRRARSPPNGSLRFCATNCVERRGIRRAVLGLSGGVDSAVTAFCARARSDRRTCTRSDCRIAPRSAVESGRRAARRRCAWASTARRSTSAAAVDGYLQFEPDADARRRGNVMARTRMVVLFDQSAKLDALPVGTGNKTERLLGIFHLARRRYAARSIRSAISSRPKSGRWRAISASRDASSQKRRAPISRRIRPTRPISGITYARADAILAQLLLGYSNAQTRRARFRPADVALVRRRVDSTHWKRHLPTTAMVSEHGDQRVLLRPVDYCMSEAGALKQEVSS